MLHSDRATWLFFLPPPPPPPTSCQFQLISVTSCFTRLSMKSKYVCRGLIGLYVNFHNNRTMWSINLHVKICRWVGKGKRASNFSQYIQHRLDLLNNHSTTAPPPFSRNYTTLCRLHALNSKPNGFFVSKFCHASTDCISLQHYSKCVAFLNMSKKGTFPKKLAED